MDLSELNLLLAADGSEHALAAGELLTGLCWPPGSKATVLGAVPPPLSLIGIGLKTHEEVQDIVARLRQLNYASARVVAARAAQALQSAGLAAAVDVREGAPAPAVLALAAALPADLVALGARGFGRGGLRLGATARRVASNAACSVLVARGRRADGPLRILLAIDGLTDVAAVRQWACALAASGRPATAEVLVASLTGWPADVSIPDDALLARQPEEELIELRALEVAEAIQDLGLRVRSVFPTGEPRAELLRLARAARTDLVVVGGSTGAPSHLGSLAWAALKYAPCSVMIARPLRSGGPAGNVPAAAVPDKARRLVDVEY